MADDDVEVCTLVRFKLEQLGHDTLLAHDGEEAMRSALDVVPDLVLLDWMMPRSTGIEVCEALRATPMLARVPIVMLTARARESDLERGFAAGADDYVTKPFSLRELASRVEALLERARR